MQLVFYRKENGKIPVQEFFILILCVLLLAWMNICAPHMCSAHRGQIRALDPLELGLQRVVNCHVDAEN